MKALLLTLALVALLFAAPAATASPEPPVCGDQSPKACVLYVAEQVFGPCHPLVNNVRECDPTS